MSLPPILLVVLLTTGCEHLCLNYVDCDARTHLLEQQIATLRAEIQERDDNLRQVRLAAAAIESDRCDVR